MYTYGIKFFCSSIDIGECLDNKNIFIINRSWPIKKENKYPSLTEFLTFEFILDNENKSISECEFRNTVNVINCEFKGSGYFKIKEQYFKRDI